jgi:predicted ATP-dependent Lon-type protease
LVGGVWCIADLSYEYSDDHNAVPWILDSVKPIQLSSFDLDGYLAVRREFSDGRMDRSDRPEYWLQPRILRPAAPD